MCFSLWFFLKTMWHIFDSALIILDFIQGWFLIALDVFSWDKTLITYLGSGLKSLEHLQIVLGLCHFYRWPDSHYNTILPNHSQSNSSLGMPCFCPYVSPRVVISIFVNDPEAQRNKVIFSRSQLAGRWKGYSNPGLFGSKLIVFPLFHSRFLY